MTGVWFAPSSVDAGELPRTDLAAASWDQICLVAEHRSWSIVYY